MLSLGNHLQTYVFFQDLWNVDFMQTTNPPPSVMANKVSILANNRAPSKFMKLFRQHGMISLCWSWISLFCSLTFWAGCSDDVLRLLKMLIFGLCSVFKLCSVLCTLWVHIFYAFPLFYYSVWVVKSFFVAVAFALFLGFVLETKLYMLSR